MTKEDGERQPISSSLGFGHWDLGFYWDLAPWSLGFATRCYTQSMATTFSTRCIIGLLLALAGCVGPSGANHTAVQSGLQKGDDIIPWNPIHVAGPNAGTNACPVCTYEYRPAVVIFTHDDKNLVPLIERLQALVDQQHKMDLKGFVIVMNSTPERLQQLGIALSVRQIGLCYPNTYDGDRDLKAYRINPDAQNTILVYKNYKVTNNFVNLAPAEFNQVQAAVTQLQ
jgi:hypothetical protein